LPNDLPAQSVLKTSNKRVFAHYFSPFPISFDNKETAADYYTRHYLTPTGESGKHLAYGGYLRDRPLPRAVSADADWQYRDMVTEVQRASDSGIDGFTYDMLALSGVHWDRLLLMLRAAHDVGGGFKIMLMPDAFDPADATNLANAIAGLATGPYADALHRLDDGRLVVSPYAPERKAVTINKVNDRGTTYWKKVLSVLAGQGINVAFVPCFLDYTSSVAAYDSFSYGYSNWGNRNTASNANVKTKIADAHNRGKIWMQPVAVQDVRPKSSIYDEASNSENFRLMWGAAISGGADWVQIPTWNDYSESTHLSPSVATGWAPLDLNSYYLDWFKGGAQPEIKRDVVYLSHRSQPYAALPTGGQTSLMKLRSGSTPARDTVEVLSFLTAPAVIEVVIGGTPRTYTAPAGISAHLFPLAVGEVSATITASDASVTTVTSPYRVEARLPSQDLSYHFVSSARSGVTTPPPGVVEPPVDPPPVDLPPVDPPVEEPPVDEPVDPPAEPVTVRLNPTEDAYAYSSSAASNYGTNTQLSAQGGTGGSESFLRFALPAAPAGTTLTGVRFAYRTSTDGSSGSADPYSLDVSVGGWEEALIDWNNRPTGVGAAVATLNAPAADTAYEATGNPAALRDALGQSVSLRISGTGNDNIRPWSREQGSAADRPALILDFTPDSGGGTDTEAPTTPPGVTSSVSENDVTLSWDASSDNVDVTGYTVYRGTAADFTIGGASKVADTNAITRTLQDQNRAANTYYYRVVASDAEGNTSVASAAHQVDVVDSTAPTAPTGLQANVSGSNVALTWPASSDNVGVSGYSVHRGATAEFNVTAGSKIADVTTTSHTDSSVPAGTHYYKVVAKDASNNTSPASGPATATVTAPPAQTQTVRLNPTADAYVSGATPATNNATYTQLSAKGGSTGSQSFLRFALPAAPAGTTLTGVSFAYRTSTDTSSGSVDPFSLHVTTPATWVESLINWNNRPTAVGATVATLNAPAVNTAYQATGSPAALRDALGQNVSLRISGSSNDNIRPWSREHGTVANRPALILTFTRS
jgi:hypothetical protein